MPAYHPFDPAPRRPGIAPPPLSCDCQFHVFGPVERFPPREGAAYNMPTATWSASVEMHRTLGIERGVIVQPTTYGSDHGALFEALAQGGEHHRGVIMASVLVEAGDAELARLRNAGVRGARINLLKELGAAPTAGALDRAVAKCRELGWLLKVQPDSAGILPDAHLLERIDIPVIVDHMGRAVPGEEGRPTIEKLIELMKRGNFYVMLSNFYKVSREPKPWRDMVPIARAFIEAAPDRLIWSSDWPHPLSMKPPPNDGDLLEFLYACAPEEAIRHQILVATPQELFQFGPRRA